MDKLLGERDEALQEVLVNNKETIKQIHHQHEKATEAVQIKHAENRVIRDEITKEIEDRQKRLKDEQAAEQAKKEELIRQLRELEKIPIQRY